MLDARIVLEKEAAQHDGVEGMAANGRRTNHHIGIKQRRHNEMEGLAYCAESSQAAGYLREL